MILILKSEEIDITSEEMFLWGKAMNLPIKIMNVEDIFNKSRLSILIENLNDSISFGNIQLDDVKTIILRKWIRYNKFVSKEIKNLNESNDNIIELSSRLKFEIKKVSDYLNIIFEVKKINQIPKLQSSYVNKLFNLYLAKSIGLLIPDSIVTNSIDEVQEFQRQYQKILTKPIFEAPTYQKDDKVFIFKNDLLNASKIEFSDDIVFPSLIQRYIDKKYEIRSFYLFGKFYSMAIFSQNDKQTSIDFRNYNSKKPNRRVPYLLPVDIEEKLRTFMEKLDLNTGSFDIIKATDDKYYFLEVNPVGQFGMVSYPCNYFLEEKMINHAK